jgi:hypothetical protein
LALYSDGGTPPVPLDSIRSLELTVIEMGPELMYRDTIGLKG